MKLLKLTATFGCLDGAELELRDGLNVFTLPNESGKSTWAAFLTAMFYGVDTAQRAGKGKLPDKHRYQPWNGKPMAGTMELEHEGRILVIQRTSQRGRPMGAFRAWDKATGLDVPELTAENCGQRLLGVEKAVFCRSAFLSGADLAVTQDQDLSRRLAALAASGAEHDSFPQADQTLKLWQNRCRYHKTGLIPETEEKLRQVKDLLAEVEDLRRQRLAAMAELKQASGEADALDQAARETQEQQRQALQAAAEEAHLHAETLASQTANLPGEEALRELRVRLSQAGPGDIPEDGPCPPALAGLDAEAVWPKAQADAAEYERLTAGRLLAMPLVCLLSAAAAGLAAVVLLCFRLWLAAGCWRTGTPLRHCWPLTASGKKRRSSPPPWSGGTGSWPGNRPSAGSGSCRCSWSRSGTLPRTPRPRRRPWPPWTVGWTCTGRQERPAPPWSERSCNGSTGQTRRQIPGPRPCAAAARP